MMFEDWRDADAADVVGLYDDERRRWMTALGWDLAPSWAIVEEARRSGRVPGLLARDREKRVVGWTFYVLYEGVLQIGGLVGESAAAVRGLLDRAIQSPEGQFARGFTGFLFPASPSLQSALERQRFTVARHLYLEKALVAGESEADEADDRLIPLARVDAADVVRLLARAYAGQPEARCFAPDGRLEQWAHYVGQLLASPAIGRYLPEASFVVVDRETRRPVGVIVTTGLSEGTAHVAQVVVDPGCRGTGLGRTLVRASAHAAQAAGHARLTLLVAENNRAARALYAREGFHDTTHFLYAARPALTRRVLPAPLRPPAARL